MATNFLCFLIGAVVGVVMTCLCNINYDDSREREWNEWKSDMEEFDMDEDLKEVTKGRKVVW